MRNWWKWTKGFLTNNRGNLQKIFTAWLVHPIFAPSIVIIIINGIVEWWTTGLLSIYLIITVMGFIFSQTTTAFS